VPPATIDKAAPISVQTGAGLHGISINGIKHDENINILGPCTEAERHRR
jgi:hypothetical protein